MAALTGAMTTTNVLSDQLAIDLGDTISLLEPSAQPLAVFSRAAGKKRTVATKFSWLEDVSKPRFDTTAGAVAGTTATAIPVTNPTYYQQWDQVLNTRTGATCRRSSPTTRRSSARRWRSRGRCRPAGSR
jgi:hypothetical protein